MPSPPSAAAGGVFWPDSSTCSLGPVNAPGVPSANTVYYLCATTTSLAAHTRLLTQVWGLTPSNFGFQAAFTNIYTSTPDRGLAAMAMWSYFSCRVPQRMPLGSVEGVWQLQYYTPSLVLSPPPPARTSGAQGGTSRGAGWLLYKRIPCYSVAFVQKITCYSFQQGSPKEQGRDAIGRDVNPDDEHNLWRVLRSPPRRAHHPM